MLEHTIERTKTTTNDATAVEVAADGSRVTCAPEVVGFATAEESYTFVELAI